MNESMELIPFKWILRGKYGRKSGFCEVNWLRRGGISAPGPPGALGRGRREGDAPRRRRRKAAKMDAPVSASRSLSRGLVTRKSAQAKVAVRAPTARQAGRGFPPLTETRVFWLLEPPAPVMEEKQGERLRARS